MSLAIYIHIPFCSRRCDYCDFATWDDKDELVETYVETLIHQMRYQFNTYDYTDSIEAGSIFFGGGTPNYINAKYIIEIIEAIGKQTTILDSAEITIESNPDHVNIEKLIAYKSAGVNRISLGIQSTNQQTLDYLGREHNRDNVFKSRELISQSGITNVSGDLIYGSPTEDLEQWRQTLDDIVSLDLTHVSAYALGIEKGTPLGNDVAHGIKQETDEDDLANKYEITEDILTFNSYMSYEISNWAKAGYESRHNLTYWRGGDVMALGCSAHGTKDGQRYSTPRNINTYIDRFSPINTQKPIDDKSFVRYLDSTNISRQEEEFALSLRTRYGVIWDIPISESLKELIDAGFVQLSDTNRVLSLTVKGRLMAHSLIITLFQEYKEAKSFLE